MIRKYIILVLVLAIVSKNEAFTSISVSLLRHSSHTDMTTSVNKASLSLSTGPFRPPVRIKSSSPTELSALLDPSILSTALTQDGIHDAFSVATFLPQPFWVLLTLLPNTTITKNIMGGMQVVTLCALVHFFIVVASIVQPGGSAPLAEFADVFDPAGDPQTAFIGMMQYPNFITEEWSHVLTWDLFVGRWIWLDGLERGIFTSHSVLLCNLIGPPGLLLHWATCLVTGKGIVGNQVPSEEE